MMKLAHWRIPLTDSSRPLPFVSMLLFVKCFGAFGAPLSESDVEFFESKIRPLLIENCYECHDAASGGRKGGLDLGSASGLRKGGDSGSPISSDHPEASLLLEAVRYQNRDLQMPPRSQLSAGDIALLENWMERGAPDPRPETSGSAERKSGMTLEEGREHWSLSIPKWSSPPPSKNPIDFFVGRMREALDLPAAAPADSFTWLRRVSYDLTGLPPTLEMIEEFEEDSSPQARTRLVDSLIGSEDYGIRWGRHWLDVARYADSNGLDENLAFANAWKYRDYVMESFRSDRPFDEFLIQQIAGDLLDNPSQEDLVATGFLALGARVLAEPDKKKLEMDVIDEQIDTLGKTFLGLTLGCARCHDHKFDPILQSDYYSLAAILRNSKNFAESKTGAIHHWYEHDFASESETEALKPIEEAISLAKKKASKFKSDTQVRLRGEARAKAVDYLVAALEFDESATLKEIRVIAEQANLHPRILHHTRRHLAIEAEHEVFAPWWEFQESDDREGLRTYYEERFGNAVLAFTKLQKEDPKAKSLPDEKQEAYRAALFDTSGFLALPAKPEHAFSSVDLDEYNKLTEAARILESDAPDRPGAMGISDQEEIADMLPIHIRGSHRNMGKEVPRAVPAVFTQRPQTFSAKSSGRLELARWMANPDHPMTARVFVNRVWRWHFGQGLVRTTENFGALGDPPSHPELLDWLAHSLVENGWSLHSLHRMILLSDTYALSTTPPTPEVLEEDPENRFLTHFPIRRLESEAIRDSILAVAGRLQSFKGGKTIPLRNRQMVFNHTSKDHTTYDSLIRSAFLPVVRNHVYDWMHLFDYPDPTMPTGNRAETVIAPQALLLMNSSLALDSAEAFSSRIRQEETTVNGRLDLAWRLAFSRSPSEQERSQSQEFLAQIPDREAGWDLLCQNLLSSNAFLYLQ